jgi:hypothetical protein
MTPGFRQVVGIDGEVADAGPNARVHRPCDERPVKQGHQRFGQVVGERTQARSESGTGNESVLHGHALTCGGWLFKHWLDKPANPRDARSFSG